MEVALSAGYNVRLQQQRQPSQSVRTGRGEVQPRADVQQGPREGGGPQRPREASVTVTTLTGSNGRGQGRAVRLCENV